MIAAEAFKIMVSKEILGGFDMEMHILVYDEKLKQLKHDLEEKWLFQHEGAIARDLKFYLKEFAQLHRIKPEDQSQLEDFDSTQDDFRETMIFLARKLNESGKVHIILMDEVELQNVASIKSQNGLPYVDVDLSYLEEYENVKFIICLKPTFYGCKNFEIQYSKKRPNQYVKHFQNRYRNCKEIYDLLSYWQQNDPQSDVFPMLSPTENLNVNWLPPSLNGGVIWVPMTPMVEQEALNEMYSVLDTLQESHSISILYHKEQSLLFQRKTKSIAMKIKKDRNTWSGPHEHLSFNGGESDVVIYICKSGLNLQTMARARKLLIMLTLETDWNNTFPLMKKAIFKQNIGGMIRLHGCLYDIINCCGSEYEDQAVLKHKKETCLERQVKCQNSQNGCKWAGKEKENQNHVEKDCQWHKCFIDGCVWIGNMSEKKMNHGENCSENLVSCSNKRNGCTRNFKNKDLSNHLQQECLFFKCSNYGCEWIGNKIQEVIHKKRHCLYEEENCQFCGAIITSGTREKHFQHDCNYLNEKENCPYCRKSFVRKNINEHKHGLFQKTYLQLAFQKNDTDVHSWLHLAAQIGDKQTHGHAQGEVSIFKKKRITLLVSLAIIMVLTGVALGVGLGLRLTTDESFENCKC